MPLLIVTASMDHRVFSFRKSPGRTTYDVVRLFKRAFGTKKVGHAGSLDGPASGVVLLCTGRATKITPFLMDLPKSYQGTIRLGVATDTYDAEGCITRQAEVGELTDRRITEVVESFEGDQSQTPPMVSALKHKGRPLYQLARQGLEVERSPRRIKIYSCRLLSVDLPEVRVRVECSRGTYMRSFAVDFGERLGLPAHLASLERTAIGPFEWDDAVPDVELLEENPSVGPGKTISQALKHLRSVELKPGACPGILNGCQPDISSFSQLPSEFEIGEKFALEDPSSRVIAVAEAVVSGSSLNRVIVPGHPLRLIRVFDPELSG